MQIKSAVKGLLERQLDKEYKKHLAERKVDYDTWIRRQERGSSGSVGTAHGDTEGPFEDFVVFIQRRGQLAKRARQWIGEFFAVHTECQVLYGDEDVKGSDGVRETPWYKPCWSPDLYLDCFYPGSVIAVRRELAETAGIRLSEGTGTEGGQGFMFENPEDIRQTIDVLLDAAGGFHKGCKTIGRLPQVLFHADHSDVWEAYLSSPAERQQVENEIRSSEALVSVIIPSRDNPQVLKKCLDSLERYRTQGAAEIIVVDNGSSGKNRTIVTQMTKGMTYLYAPMEFNFSAICNLGASKAKGKLLLFLNDDVEMGQDDWLEQMRQKALQPYAGAVGLKLYYPDSIKIQHDGITNLPVGPVHKLQFYEDNKRYYFGWNRHDRNCLAVTGACLMIESNKFREAGGFCRELKVAYNDVALGFQLWRLGYQNVLLNHCNGYHHESLTRGSDETWEKQQRLEEERALLYEMYPELRSRDPYYPEQLNIEGLDSRIVPGFITAYNTVQEPSWGGLLKRLDGYREDNCLMVRIESTGPEKIQGYGVVLGDDNACYEQFLFLEPEEEPDQPLCMRLLGQYRDDLEANLPDQKNVALGGFCVSRAADGLAPGVYRIGLIAAHRISGLRLLGWSGKCLRVEQQD